VTGKTARKIKNLLCAGKKNRPRQGFGETQEGKKDVEGVGGDVKGGRIENPSKFACGLQQKKRKKRFAPAVCFKNLSNWGETQARGQILPGTETWTRSNLQCPEAYDPLQNLFTKSVENGP